jgi:hypothetical protein
MDQMRGACGACGHDQVPMFLDLGKTPLANKLPATADEAEISYPLQLGRCQSCGLVQQLCVISDDLIYGEDYAFYSGASAAQRDYHSRGAEHLLRVFGAVAEKLTVEIACNDGTLLQHFATAGCEVIGVDPAGPAQVAIDAGLPVYRRPFTAKLGQEIRDDHGPAGLVIAYNSLAHVSDLADVLTGMWALLDEWGVAVVEVQYLPDLLVGNMYGQIYHEHRYHWSLTTFRRAAELHGLFLLDAELIELQGGGMRITLAKRPVPSPSARARRILDAERWLDEPGAFAGVQGRIDRARDHLLTLIGNEMAAGRMIAGYAASAKATTILNYCGLTVDQIPFVVDTTEYKRGRYVPGVKIPIVSEADPRTLDVETFLLFAPNYLAHLIRAHHDWFTNGGRWLISEPSPALI